MVYEIEKRSLFESSNDFKQCESEVAKIGKATNKYIFKSFLFKSPEYLRIRIVLEKDTAEITKKIGTYEDAAREEINEHISLQKLPNFIKGLIKEGYDKCTCVKTESNNYEIGELTISFNTIESLGMIIEIEALTNEKSQNPIKGVLFCKKKKKENFEEKKRNRLIEI